MDPHLPADSAQAERDAFIAQLEKDLDRRPSGLLPPVAAIAFLAALVLAWWMKDDTAYFFSPSTPIELGAEGDYHLERALSNRYAQVHGLPSARGWYTEEPEGSFVVLGVNDTKMLLRRATFEDENRRLPDGKRPQPRQNPFFAKGRLLHRSQAVKYDEIFREYEIWGGTNAEWILLAEKSPGQDFSTVAIFGFVMLFAAVNAWLFFRGRSLARRS